MRKLLCVLVIVCFMLPMMVFADASDGSPTYIRVQGAKLVSEGAYFRFALTNIAKDEIDVMLSISGYNNCSLFGVSDADYTLGRGETTQINMVAPWIAYDYRTYSFSFTVISIGSVESLWEVVRFGIYVVDLPTLVSAIGEFKGWTYDDLWQENHNLRDYIDVLEGDYPPGNPVIVDISWAFGYLIVGLISCLAGVLIGKYLQIRVKSVERRSD